MGQIAFRLLLFLSLWVSLANPAHSHSPVSKQVTGGPPQEDRHILTNSDVLSLVATGLSTEVIVAKIKSSACAFDTSPNALAELKKAGVSDSIILAVVQAPFEKSRADMTGAGPNHPPVVRGELETCDANPLQPECRRQTAQLTQDAFTKSRLNIMVTVSGAEATSIVFTSRATLGNKSKRAMFRQQFVGSEFETNLCKFGFNHFVLAGSDGSEEYRIDCPPMRKQSERTDVPTEMSTTTGGTARIRGTLTYYFNNNYGSRADTGSEIWLIKGQIEIPSDSFFVGLPDQVTVDKTAYSFVAHTIADGNGLFDLGGIQPGDYTLIIQSNHTKGASDSGAASVTMRDIQGRVVTFPITIGPDQTIDKSWDFGISSF